MWLLDQFVMIAMGFRNALQKPGIFVLEPVQRGVGDLAQVDRLLRAARVLLDAVHAEAVVVQPEEPRSQRAKANRLELRLERCAPLPAREPARRERER